MVDGYLARLASILLSLLLLSACSRLPDCPKDTGAPALLFSLYFGRNIPARPPLTDAEWTRFVDTTVTPALPDGYTIFDADGAWLKPGTMQTIRDPTKVLQVALPATPQSIAIVNHLRSAYQAEFHQQLVGLVTHPACAAF
jgi:hypothetical protein